MSTENKIVGLVVAEPVKFNFRENKETKVKRPALELVVPKITTDAVANYLMSEDTKVVSLVLETLQGVINGHVRSYVDSDENFSQEALQVLVDEGKISFEAIANLPRAERSAVTNADLEEFSKVYFKLSQTLLGKSEPQASAAVVVFNSRIKKIAGNPAALAKVESDLAKFLELADQEVISEHERALNYLISKIADYKAEDITEDSL